MAYGTLYLQEKWYSEATPTNPKPAIAILTFTGNAVAAETVTIDGVVFEFVATALDIADEDNIPVVCGADFTSDNAVEKLVAAINANMDNIVASAGVDASENNYCGLAYYKVGTEGNAIEVSETCTNASFGVGVTKLSGGQYGTPSIMKNVIVEASPYYYWCDKEGGESTVSWKRFIPADY